MSPTSEREKRNVIDRASVLAGLSVALWERMRGANLRFGGGRVSTGARSKASVAGAERESRRWNGVPKALRELWERDGNETGTRRERDGNETKNPDRDQKDPVESPAPHVAQASPPAVSHASRLPQRMLRGRSASPAARWQAGRTALRQAGGLRYGSRWEFHGILRRHSVPPSPARNSAAKEPD